MWMTHASAPMRQTGPMSARSRSRQAAVALAACALAAAASAGPAAAAPAPAKKAPAGLAFYTPPTRLTGQHGDVIWSRKLTGTAALSAAGANTLVLYRSTSIDGKKIAVSGTVSVPRGKAPKGGWPVITWTHATTGSADICAPSRDSATNPAHADIAYVYPTLNAWLKKGFAVVRTDYEGLGTPGPHPYLIGASEGRGAIDIVRAARKLDPRIGTTLLVGGHSQGGQAALFATSLAKAWAPELKLKGLVAVAPASHIKTIVSLAPTFTTPGGSLSGTGAAQGRPKVDLQALLSPETYALVGDVEKKCLGGLSEADSWGGIAPNQLLKEGADQTALQAVLTANDPETLHLTVPVLLLQGSNDTAVFPFFTDGLDKSLVANGAKVEYKTYPGKGHYDVFGVAGPDATAWLVAHAK
jgi:fermentation-respiration switch protein FrsA (DUF1100 family)